MRNSSIELFQGKHLRLAVSKWGKISIFPDNVTSTPEPPATINTDLNLSLIDLNLVPPDIWLEHPTDSQSSHKSIDSSSRQTLSLKQQHPSFKENKPRSIEYRKKGRGHHERTYQLNQSYHDKKSQYPSMSQYQNSNPMLTSNMIPNNMNMFPPMYSDTPYYQNYGARMQGTNQSSHQFVQHRKENDLFWIQYHNLQQQMQHMEQMINHGGTQTDPNNLTPRSYSEVQSQARFPNADVFDSQPQMFHQPRQGLRTQQHVTDEERRDPQNLGTSSFNMEMPLSPQMNPNAATFSPNAAVFSPNYTIPGKRTIHEMNRQYP